ncbi:hypothetical protein BDU57DRAFT_61988 [Ampelomyces quisqualis]|uniref:Uncharacterized protein n=1 Tax=Ampelomyces quisqualis TaxID=50730 RepID=A0A6A5R7C0_AMPQU|nr:hypothetical protein BDU57DRAFT_61988 [Ampelomyces quisqualis]
MGRKTKYVPLEWSSRASEFPTAPLQRCPVEMPERPAESEQMVKGGTQASVEPASACNGQVKKGEALQQIHDEETLPSKSQAIRDIATVAHSGALFGISSWSETSSRTTQVLSSTENDLQAGFEECSLTTYHGTTCPRAAVTHQESFSRGPPTQSPPTTPASASTSRSLSLRTASSNLLTPSPAKTPSGPRDDRSSARRPVKFAPVPGKVYFMPDGRSFPGSIIHNQKRQDGFFRHPIMVTEVEGDFAHLYAMTKIPPRAIRELNMALLLGSSTEDIGSNVLRLAPGSELMMQESWINLEQRFCIEWKNLDDWAAHVQADQFDLGKLFRRVAQLEADQNRYIYKPLPRDMSIMQPGMILMLPNAPNTATFGAPVIVIKNKYPSFQYLRVKRFEDNIHFNPQAKRHRGSIPALSLRISKSPAAGHSGTPVMLLEHHSPAMREESYIEVQARPVSGQLDECRTWCWPPVKVCEQSMRVLCEYMARVASRGGKVMPMYNQPVCVQYFQPPAEFVPGAQWHPYTTMQNSGYNVYTPQMTPAYGPGGYVLSFGG